MFNQHGFANPLQQQGQPQLGNNAAAAGGGGGGGAGPMGIPAGAGMNLQQMMAMGANGINMNGLMGQAMPMGMGGSQQQQTHQGGQDGQNAAAMSAMANMNSNLMFNPQLQALLQQQMQQHQHQQNQQQQQQQSTPQPHPQQPVMTGAQQGIRWPGAVAGQQPNLQQFFMNQNGIGQQQPQQGMSGANAGQTGGGMAAGQPFNPFMQQQQQQQQQSHLQQPQQQHYQPQSQQQQSSFAQPGPSNAPGNFIPPNILNAIHASQQQQGQQGAHQSQGIPGQAQGMNMDPAALMAAAAQASGGLIDPNTLLQNAGLLAGLQGFGAGPSNLNGSLPPGMQHIAASTPAPGPGPLQAPTPGPMQAPTPVPLAHGMQQSPKPPPSSSGLSTPEPKAKGRPRGSTKKKKDDDQQSRGVVQQQQQQQQQHTIQAPAGPTQSQTNFAQAAPSPAPSMFQTPTQSHAAIPMASPAQAFAQQQERARSHTRSPSMSGAPHIGTPGPVPRQFSGSGPMPGGSSAAHNGPAGWTPSLTPVQQQQLLGQALSFSKAQSARGGNAQPGPSPAQTLMQMGYIYVKANVLPNNGFGAGIPGNGPSGAGAVLSIEEAKAIGIFGPHQHGQQPGQMPPQGHAHLQAAPPQQQQQQQQQQPTQQPMPGMPGQAQNPNQMMSQAHMNIHQPHSMLGQPQSSMQMPPGLPGSGPHTPQHPIMGAPGIQQAQQAGYRASPLGMSGSPAPASIPPSSPAPTTGSPAVKANARQRQASTSSRPASSAGRANNDAQMAAASYAPFTQPAHAGALPPSRSGSVSGPAPQSPFSSLPLGVPGAVPSNAGMAGAPSAVSLPPPNVSLPPVNGGPLPKKTKLGFDVAPEYNTRLTPLPASDVMTPKGTHHALSELWKPLTKEQEAELIEIMRKDSEYTKLINAYAGRTQDELMKRFNELRPLGRLHWWERSMEEDQTHLGKDGPYQNFKILLPADKRSQRAAQGIRSALNGALSSRQVRLDRKAAAQLDDDLVPIRLEIDHEGWRLRDTFTWPAPESYKMDLLERFATTLCEDFGLPTIHFTQAIREAILSQVQDHTAAEALRPAPSKRKRDEAMGKGRITAEEAGWWKKWRDEILSRSEGSARIQELDDSIEEESAVERANGIVTPAKQPDMRIQIKLDITVGAMNLVDQFEWDVSDEGSSAEDFATAFAADLGLSGEFRTAIAHSIREQVDVYIRSLALIGYSFDGADVLDEELRGALLAPVSCIARMEQDVDAHTPKLMQLSELEIMQMEKEREREARRKRRQTRGRRGVNLPDREPLKTARTPAVHGLQSNVSAGADAAGGDFTYATGSRAAATDLGSSTRSTAGMSTRRAAAVLANANISNATASGEYGTPTPQPEDNTRLDHKKEAAKRRKLESHAAHFEYPGGLGKIDDEMDDEPDRGPRFAPNHVDSPSRVEPRAAELGGMPPSGASKAARHGLGNLGHGTSSPSTAVAWNMARPEEALNQVPNWHDGMWYCSNCGVPGNMDPTRRKGPLGDKTLCGMCGKYFHRHRKARPVDYTRSVQHHLKQLQQRGITPNMAEVEDMLAREKAAGAGGRGAKVGDGSSIGGGIVGRGGPGAGVNAALSSELGTTADMSTTTDSVMAPSSISDAQPAESAAMAPEVIASTVPEPAASTTEAAAAQAIVPVPAAEAQSVQPVEPAQVTESGPVSTSAPVKEEKATASFPTTRGNSPDLPFEQVGSPDDSDSDDEENPQQAAALAVGPASPVKAASQKLTPARSVSPSKAQMPTPMVHSSSSGSGLAHGSPAPPPGTNTAPSSAVPPEWLSEASRALRVKYPLDRFEVITRPRPAGVPAGPTPEWRIRCQDCPGKLYTPGPGDTLTNFEIHLRNRVHRANVQKASQQEGRKPYVP